MRLRNSRKRISQFAGLSGQDKRWLLLSFISLGFCRSIILLLPLRYIVPFLGKQNYPQKFCVCPTQIQICKARRIGRMIRIVAKYTFFNSTCLVQATAARILLGRSRIPYLFYFGVNKNVGNTLQAHAWVCVGPVFVTGGDGFADYTTITVYSNEGYYPREGGVPP
jgi:hypothetical protein